MASDQTLYPIYLKLDGKPCLVVGGGDVATRKVNLLVEGGAFVTVVSPEISDGIRSFLEQGRVKHVKGEFRKEYIEGYTLVIGATDNPQVNSAVAKEARKRGLWVNIVDSPEESDFFVPSMVKRGELTIAISTGGKSPALAKKVREELEEVMGEEYALLLDFLGELRADATASIKGEKERTSLYTQIVNSEILSMLKKGQRDKARAKAREILKGYGLPYKKEYLG